MRIAAAVLCDFATVREGLLTVVSGGITRLHRERLPAPLGVAVALLVEVSPAERPFPHQLTIVVTSPSGRQIAKADGAFQVGDQSVFDPDEIALVPFTVGAPRTARVEEWGWITFSISIDGEEQMELRVKAVPRPTLGPAQALPVPRSKPPTH